MASRKHNLKYRYGITEEDQSMLAGFSLSGASFKLPASQGEVREPAWSDFLR